MSLLRRKPKPRRSWVEEVVQAMIWGGLLIGVIIGVVFTALFLLAAWWLF